MKTNEIYEKVTEKIIANLETAGSWRALWAMPRPVSLQGYAYHGMNLLNLACSEYEQPVWGTFQQIRQNGGFVKKGEVGTIVVFWKPSTTQDPVTGEEKFRFLLKYYYVFNVGQCEFDEIGKAKILKVTTLLAQQSSSNTRQAEEIVENMPQRPPILFPSLIDYPNYVPSLDVVNMPKPEFFVNMDSYYAVLYHELVHATGHKSRLDRGFILGAKSENKEDYSKEELVAELGASYLAEVAGLEVNIDQAAAYIKGWSSRLRDNASWIVWAAARAEKAADFILGNTKAVPSEVETMPETELVSETV